jgi:Fur family zinc uptake transcriptional regulator
MAKMSHQHEELQGDALVEAAERAVVAAGEQWTPMRASVFEALISSGPAASAYDITERLSKTRGKRVAANSVYRILDLFVRANVAQRIESQNAYLANQHPGCRHDCLFMICDTCGETTHVDDDRLTSSVRSIAAQAGFAATRPIFEVRGLCRKCAYVQAEPSTAALSASA